MLVKSGSARAPYRIIQGRVRAAGSGTLGGNGVQDCSGANAEQGSGWADRAHLNVKTGSRTTGQSAAAKYDYISRDGRYARACQDEVVHLESGSMPAFASSDARVYWAAADSHERSNGRLFRSLTAALPNSLDLAGRQTTRTCTWCSPSG